MILAQSNRACAPRGLRLVGADDVVVDDSSVTLPDGIGFDPGGIGKGLAADLVSAEVIAAGAAGVCVDVGGDLRVRGSGPGGGNWTISIDHPRHPAPLALVGLVDGAVATSTTLLRRWRVGGEYRNHLIDPRTGRSTDSPIELCSVVAADAWVAETLAKATLIRGGPHPFDLVDGTGAEALVVGTDGSVQASAGFDRFTGRRGLDAPERTPTFEEVA